MYLLISILIAITIGNNIYKAGMVYVLLKFRNIEKKLEQILIIVII